MASWKAYLIDLDGTLYHGSRIISGAEKLIHAMKSNNIPYLFVTNNSTRTPADVALHLQSLGIPALEEDVCTSAVAAAQYVKEQTPHAKVAPIGETGLLEALSTAGLTVDYEQPDVVVQGLDRLFTYEKLTQATRWIIGGASYILTNPDLLLPTQEGLMPGAGTISAAIKAATGIDPVVIGKPSSILMKHAIDRLGLQNEEVAVIGDNMMTDISAGVNAGCGSILTLTGVTTDNNLQQMIDTCGIQPDIICNSLDDVLNLIMASKSNIN